MVPGRRSGRAAARILLALCAAGCGGEGDTAVRPDAAPAAGASDAGTRDGRPTYRKPAAERRPIDPQTTGAIRGVVVFKGEPPERKPLSIAGAAGCDVEGHAPLSERVIVADGRLANVFAYVSAGLEAWELPGRPNDPVVLDQTGCTYVPHVAGIQVGQTLRVRNNDGTTHNVHARPKRNDSFNRTQPPSGAPLEHVFDRREIMVPIVCDIHPWMKTWLGVVEHPFHAVSRTDGTFAIEGLPPGTYTLSAWHEAYDARKIELTIQAGGETRVELVFP